MKPDDRQTICVCACGHRGTLKQLAAHDCPPPEPTMYELSEQIRALTVAVDELAEAVGKMGD